MNFDDLSPEVKEKALACTSTDELVALAKAESIELSEEALEKISGGSSWRCASVCPQNAECFMVECKTRQPGA